MHFLSRIIQACPHDNVGILSRPPASELITDPRRSGIGFFSRRKDIAALALVFTFGALLNAFGMVSPVYALESWLGRMLHVSHEAPVLGLIFVVSLVVEPVLMLGGGMAHAGLGGQPAGHAAVDRALRLWAGSAGFRHVAGALQFSFPTGILTLIPVTQNAVASLGRPFLGEPLWTLTGVPTRFVQPLEMGFLVLGLAGSLLVTHRLAEDEAAPHPGRAFLPWAAICPLLWVAAVWLILQPMEMRATFMG